MIVQVCVGSSCHIKGSEDVVNIIQQRIKEEHLEDEITLAGSFCIGKCTRTGVTVQVDDEIITGITKETCNDFFDNYILNAGRK